MLLIWGSQRRCSWRIPILRMPRRRTHGKIFVWGAQLKCLWRKTICMGLPAGGLMEEDYSCPRKCSWQKTIGMGYPAEMLMEEDYCKGVPRRAAHVIIIIMVVQFDGIGSTRKHCAPVLHTPLSCGSLPDRLHSLKSLFTHSDHVFLGLPCMLVSEIDKSWYRTWHTVHVKTIWATYWKKCHNILEYICIDWHPAEAELLMTEDYSHEAPSKAAFSYGAPNGDTHGKLFVPRGGAHSRRQFIWAI